jgi:hypothetical protein
MSEANTPQYTPVAVLMDAKVEIARLRADNEALRVALQIALDQLNEENSPTAETEPNRAVTIAEARAALGRAGGGE